MPWNVALGLVPSTLGEDVTLDLTRMAGQIEAMGAHLSRSAAEVRLRLARAQARYDRERPDLGPLREKLVASQGRVTWMPAGLVEDWEDKHPLPQLPPDFTVLASDGSQIDLERHASASCYLINIGQVMLRYGSQPDARLESRASLFYRGEDLLLTDPANATQWVSVDSKLLRLRRSVMEAQALADLAGGWAGAGQGPPLPTLALLDGTLILWDLADKEMKAFVREGVLGPFLEALERLRQRPDLALASYISHPRATEVVDALRIAECPYTPPNCDRHCRERHPPERPCDQVAEGVRDADLFGQRLGPGERSPLFGSQSSILKDYGEHHVHFFYVNVGEEIARAEVPAWVAQDPQRLGLAHALVVEQARQGQGYPVALMEAHEQAVVRASDREAFWALVEEVLSEGRLPALPSPKAQSKRIRGV